MHSPGMTRFFTAKTTELAVDWAEMSAESTIIYNFAGILPNFYY